MLGLILGAGALAINVAGSIAGHNAQAKQAKANTAAANAAARAEYAGLHARELEERIAAAQQKEQGARQAQSAASLARLSAITSGVAGNSVNAVTQGVEGDLGRFNSSIDLNLGLIMEQLEREEMGVEARRQSRIAGVPGPNPWLTGLSIAGAGIDFATQQFVLNKPPSSGTSET